MNVCINLARSTSHDWRVSEGALTTRFTSLSSTLQYQTCHMPQGMEPDVRKYLFKVLNSLCYGLLWLALNVLGGLYWGYGTINGKLSVGNILFFSWFILSLIALLYSYYRMWSTGTPPEKK